MKFLSIFAIGALCSLSLEAQSYYGDVNLDGTIDQKDVELLEYQIISGNAQSYHADLSRNGVVNVGDQVLLTRTILQKASKVSITYDESANPSSGYQWFQSIENQSVADYIANVTYSGDDATEMTKYSNYYATLKKKTLPYPNISRQDWPEGVTLGEATYYNLIPGRDTTLYYVSGKSKTPVTVRPLGQVRMMRLTGIDNVRDLGGWLGLDGKRIRYGLIYRGSELSTLKPDEALADKPSKHTATTEDIQLLRSLGIKGDLDLRAVAEVPELTSPLGSDIEYLRLDESVAIEAFTTDANYLKNWADCFRFILKHIRKGESVYTHCIWGADRTGALCHLLEGLLGVCRSDIDKDFEMTSFANDLKARNGYSHSLEAIEATSGSTLQKKYYNWWNKKAGITTAELDEFISIMLKEDPVDVIPQPDTTVKDYEEYQQLENNGVHDYMTNVSYVNVAYTNYSKCSKISNYVNSSSSTPYPNDARQDWPYGVVLGDAVYYNLVPGRDYLLDYVENGQSTTVPVHTVGQVRMIKTEGTDNTRDLGGWSTISGKTVRYGLLYRGSELNTVSTKQEIANHKNTDVANVSSHNVTDKDIQLLRSTLGIYADLDLRKASEIPQSSKSISALGRDIEYANYAISIADTCFTTGEYSLSLYASCLRFILKHIRRGEAVYIHGAWGADRTGALCHLIEGLLGLSRSDLDKDFELSSFAREGKPRSNGGYKNTRVAVDECSGSTVQAKYYNWWNTKAGITKDELNEFINIMLTNSDISYAPTQCVENDGVREYLSGVEYNPATYSEWSSCAKIQYYSNDLAVNFLNNPAPYPDDFRQDWPYGVILGDTTYYNLIPGREYTLDYVSNGKATPVSVQTQGRLRMIKTEGTDNTRDLGGWRVSSGKSIKYGMLFRGSELSTVKTTDELISHNKVTTHNVTLRDIRTFREDLGIRAVLDLRTEEETPANFRTFSPLGSDIAYTRCPIRILEAIDYNDAENLAYYAQGFRFILDHVRNAEPVYIHCVWGADRTGTMCHLLEGLLGVSRSDIDKDFETTSFSNSGKSRNDPTYALARASVDACQGSTTQEKYNNWWKNKTGVTKDELEEFISLMLE